MKNKRNNVQNANDVNGAETPTKSWLDAKMDDDAREKSTFAKAAHDHRTATGSGAGDQGGHHHRLPCRAGPPPGGASPAPREVMTRAAGSPEAGQGPGGGLSARQRRKAGRAARKEERGRMAMAAMTSSETAFDNFSCEKGGKVDEEEKTMELEALFALEEAEAIAPGFDIDLLTRPVNRPRGRKLPKTAGR